MPQRTQTYLLGFLAAVTAGFVLWVAQSVLLPFVLAVFLTVVITPAVSRLSRWMPEPAALIAVLAGVGLTLVGATILLVQTVYDVAAKMPVYAQRFEDEIASLLEQANEYGVELTWENLGAEQGVGYAVDFLGSGLGSLAVLLGNLVIILFITIFLALEARQFARKVDAAFQPAVAGTMRASSASIVEQIQKYMLAKTAISLLTGLCTWILCAILGVDFALFWGVLAFVLNFVPNVGSIIAVVPPVLIAGLEFGNLTRPLLVLLLLGTTQMTIGNILEPRILGKQMSLSTLVVFLSMILWGWLWGIIGVILAVPLTVAMKIVFSHVDALRPIAIMLGGEPVSVPEQPMAEPDDAETDPSAESEAKTDHVEAEPEPDDIETEPEADDIEAEPEPDIV